MKKTIIFIIPLIFISCVSNPFKEFYLEERGTNLGAAECFLQDGETPVVKYSYNIERDIEEQISNYYYLIGISGYNGPERSDSAVRYNIEELCKEKGAKVAIYSYEYTDTRHGTIRVPESSSTTFSGNVYNRHGNSSIYGKSTTTYMSESSYSIRRGNYTAAFFVPMNKKQKSLITWGLVTMDLTPGIRSNYNRNTGVLVTTVFKDTPAFYSNIMPHDIIVGIDGVEIKNNKEYWKELINKREATFEVIHNGIRSHKFIRIE